MKKSLNAEYPMALSPEDEAEMRQIILEVLHEADGDLDIDEVRERALYRKTQRDVDWLVRHGLLVRYAWGNHVRTGIPALPTVRICGGAAFHGRPVPLLRNRPGRFPGKPPDTPE